MQHILQEYILHTCHEITQVNPPYYAFTLNH